MCQAGRNHEIVGYVEGKELVAVCYLSDTKAKIGKQVPQCS
jgi:hypothetical protein